MTKSPIPHAMIALAVAASLVGPAFVGAQSPGKDDALDRLLEKLDEPKKSPDSKKPGDVKPEDQDLDRLLKKLGESTDTPSPKGRPDGPPMPGEPKKQADEPEKPEALKEKDKPLDEHLEEILGRKRKSEQERQQQAAEENSPLREAIKKMQEVRQRLGQSDTGEGTRKTEGEIVKELDQILERLRMARMQGQGQGRRQQRTQQAGNQQGDQPQNPDDPRQGVGEQMPKKPSVSQLLAGRKDVWGDLPPSLREELENVFKEEMLPSKRDMIIRYYRAVQKKGQAPGVGR